MLWSGGGGSGGCRAGVERIIARRGTRVQYNISVSMRTNERMYVRTQYSQSAWLGKMAAVPVDCRNERESHYYREKKSHTAWPRSSLLVVRTELLFECFFLGSCALVSTIHDCRHSCMHMGLQPLQPLLEDIYGLKLLRLSPAPPSGQSSDHKSVLDFTDASNMCVVRVYVRTTTTR